MPQHKILVDSNVYFRLGREIHPFLRTEFGADKWCFYIIDGFEEEYLKNSRLKSKFHWACQEPYQQNRSRKVTLSRSQKSEVKKTIPFFVDTANDLDLGTGIVDIRALVVAYVLGIPVATDDGDMILLAKEFEIKIIKALEVLHYFEQIGRIDRAKVRAIVKHWIYSRDIPKDLTSDYKRIFEEAVPSL